MSGVRREEGARRDENLMTLSSMTWSDDSDRIRISVIIHILLHVGSAIASAVAVPGNTEVTANAITYCRKKVSGGSRLENTPKCLISPATILTSEMDRLTAPRWLLPCHREGPQVSHLWILKVLNQNYQRHTISQVGKQLTKTTLVRAERLTIRVDIKEQLVSVWSTTTLRIRLSP